MTSCHFTYKYFSRQYAFIMDKCVCVCVCVCVCNGLSTTYAIITTRGFCGVTSRGSSDKEPTCQHRRQGLTLELRRFP